MEVDPQSGDTDEPKELRNPQVKSEAMQESLERQKKANSSPTLPATIADVDFDVSTTYYRQQESLMALGELL